MFRHLMLWMLAPVFAIAASNWAEACHRCKKCCDAPAPCSTCSACDDCTAKTAYQEVEKTVMVPTIVTETRKIAVTKYRNEERTRNYTVMKNVPETKTREISKTEMIPEVRTRTIEFTERKAVTTDKEINYTVQVPQTLTKTLRWTVRLPVRTAREVSYTINVPSLEARTGTRKVCRYVPVTKTRSITEDQGHWETQAVPQQLTSDKSEDGKCCDQQPGCTALKKVWVPNVVTRDIEVTCNERMFEDQEYTYNVKVFVPEVRTKTVYDCSFVTEERTKDIEYTACKPETRTKTIQVTSYISVPKTREVQYTAMIPQVKTATEEYTVMKQVPETRTSKCTVSVPYTEEQEVPVKVCRMVAKTIKVRVAAPCAEAQPAVEAKPCCN